ncbi:MAG: methyltransferase domain-containing protein [Kurthia sp.]|nr:methyltransferase domain-containing protein [Candidatus Kurthia equi]
MNSNKYKDYFTKDYLMGPNSIRLLEELLIKNPDALTSGTILDLGCGKALTSVYITNETNANTVYATDLWISATENWETRQEWKLEDKMIPIHANALDLPFANDFFDAIVSIDSYHYYGCENEFFAKKNASTFKKWWVRTN